jgi:essential nuclear protein 1
MSKAPSAAKKSQKRHDPIAASYVDNGGAPVRRVPHKKEGRYKSQTADIDDDDYDINANEPTSFVSGRDAKRLMAVAAAQRKEEENGNGDVSRITAALARHTGAARSVTARGLLGKGGDESDDDDLEFDDEEDDDANATAGDDNDTDDADDDDEDAGGMTEADRAALEAFMPARGTQQRQTLADIIMEKIAARDRALALGLAPSAEETAVEARATAPPAIVAAYQKVGQYLSKYRAGKIPKIFKLIPTLKNWEEILYYTRPQAWSYHATSAATKMFATALNPKLAQRFYTLVLLPKVEAALEEDHKLNPHLYDALRRAMYKPAAFFKGVMLPLATRGCLLRNAIVFSSVLRRIGIPPMHAAVAIMKLTTIKPFNGAAGLFLKTLIRKRFALPLPTVAAVVEYFYSFIQDGLDYPVLWYQCILAFVQRYKEALSEDQRAMIRALVRRKHHHIMSDEIRRELAAKNGTGASAALSAYRGGEDAAIDAEMRRGGADAPEAHGGDFFMDSLMGD